MKLVFANLFRVGALLLLLILLFRTEWLSFLLVPLTSNNAPVVYTQNSLPQLAASHLFLVAISIAGSAVLAILGGIFVTRKSGEDFLPLSRAIANAGQTFPPVAVLALAVPATGFGAGPTLIALFLYGLLPIFENTVSGLKQVSPSVLDAADGMGMNGTQRLFRVELPLALPLILEGLKVATVINIGTATIGSTVAAKGLGEVIIAGLISDNTAFILQGGLIVGLMAVLIYDALGLIEKAITQRIGLRPA
ncbi:MULTISPECIES: ABC transporter permease [Rhizobium]|uniref:Osmoprotectant uptake system permease protein yehW n=1 Tax=Rhizobium favelukesii TaxID=348824 RepID=W6RPH8_9HYPH|nr:MULTISPECIES: ABC transporter permease [Rhizobium]MCS0461610.1 ABC transporter permease [Rhizobium favelukesii]UFS82086.1 ABC transporter permease [Rhizobium sp. T136]CDM56241.1 putative osmoprotectant uptake system permease protein yehW [Rhizobium favelukesii]